jgi:hypothetical protein
LLVRQLQTVESTPSVVVILQDSNHEATTSTLLVRRAERPTKEASRGSILSCEKRRRFCETKIRKKRLLRNKKKQKNCVTTTMCVTNISKRNRFEALSSSVAVGVHPAMMVVANNHTIVSAQQQQLGGDYLPLMRNYSSPPTACTATPGTVSTLNLAYREEQDEEEEGDGGAHGDEKKRPKRRRKPQKPGKTAKHNDRHFVVHNYHDHAYDLEDYCEEITSSLPLFASAEQQPQYPHAGGQYRKRGGVSVSFPLKLHAVLDQVVADGLGHVISWQPHGRCFLIHEPKEFVDHVMPTYFRQTKLTSFQRQLNLYGYCRLTTGQDSGGYYHELFLRGKQFLCRQMTRTKVKGTRFKAASSPESEPDFYKMVRINKKGARRKELYMHTFCMEIDTLFSNVCLCVSFVYFFVAMCSIERRLFEQ